MKRFTVEIQRDAGFRFELTDLALIALRVAAGIPWRAVFPEQHLYLVPLCVGAFHRQMTRRRTV